MSVGFISIFVHLSFPLSIERDFYGLIKMTITSSDSLCVRLTNHKVCLFQVIQSGSSAGLQNKQAPVRQYVTRKNHIAYRGKEVKMWCIFGGTPLPEIR